MKRKLAPATDVAAAQDAARAALAGDMGLVRARVEAMASPPALLLADVPLLPDVEEANGMGAFDSEWLRDLHGKTSALNAAMYYAAFGGHGDIVDYFLTRGDYCQHTLDAALFGAVCAEDAGMVAKLVQAGADPLAGGKLVLRRSVFCADGEIVRHLADAARAHDYIAAIHARHRNFRAALDILSRDSDVMPALDAVAARLSDRALAQRTESRDAGLDFLEALFAFAEARGDDMQALVEKTVDMGLAHWSSPLLERLVGHHAFAAHPGRQQLLDKIAARTALSSNPNLDLSYKDYAGFCDKLAEAGANPDVMLDAAATAGNHDICAALMGRGADPRRGRPPVIDRFREKAGTDAAADTLFRLAQVMARMATDNETKLLAQFHDGKTAGDALRLTDEKTGRTGFMIAAQLGTLEAELGNLTRAGGVLAPGDAAATDKRGTTLGQFVHERGEGRLFFRRDLYRSREDFTRFCENLPPALREEQAENAATVLAAFDSLEGRAAVTSKMLRSKNRWKL